jgi:hypothetical protein
MVGLVYRVKRFTTGLTNFHFGGKLFTDEKEVEAVVQKWLRQ